MKIGSQVKTPFATLQRFDFHPPCCTDGYMNYFAVNSVFVVCFVLALVRSD
jgi:hypothetical protein